MKTLFKVCLSVLFLGGFFPVTIQAESPSARPAIQPGQFLNGKAIAVASGETFTMITPENREIEVWLAEIEAPEKGQIYWDASRAILAQKVLSNEVAVQVVSIKDLEDGYDYVIAQAYIGNRWINKEMVASGWAWHFPQYFQSRELALAEQAARENKLGLWAVANPETPVEFQAPPQMKHNDAEQIQPLLRVDW